MLILSELTPILKHLFVIAGALSRYETIGSLLTNAGCRKETLLYRMPNVVKRSTWSCNGPYCLVSGAKKKWEQPSFDVGACVLQSVTNGAKRPHLKQKDVSSIRDSTRGVGYKTACWPWSWWYDIDSSFFYFCYALHCARVFNLIF